jgi:hypothetical protein
MRLSRSTIRTGILGIPAGLRRQLKESYLGRTDSEQKTETIRCNKSQAWGLRRLIVAADAEPDDAMLLEFDNRAGTVVVSFGPDSRIWERLRESGAYTA